MQVQQAIGMFGKAENVTDPIRVKIEKAEVVESENGPEQQVKSQESEQSATGGQYKNGEDENLQFTFSFEKEMNQTKYTFFGKPGDSLLEALRSSAVFKRKEQENKSRQVVPCGIEPLHGIVNHWIPCQFLPAGTYFKLLFVKSQENRIYGEEKITERMQKKHPILFYVFPHGKTEGGDNRKIISCPRISNRKTNLCVLGFKGETIQEALMLDGRFCHDKINDFCQLVTTGNPETKTQFTNTVNSLNGQVFQIEVTKAASREVMTGQCEVAAAQSSTAVRKVHSSSSKKGNGSKCISMVRIQNLPPYMRNRNETIISDFQILMKDKSQSGIVNFLKSEYKKQVDISIPVKDFPMLNAKSLSVGYIVTSSPENCSATCFILKDAYILTCYHVVEGLVGKDNAAGGDASIAKVLHKVVTVTFDDERSKLQGSSYKVKEWFEVYSKELDYAVLELEECPQRESKPLPGLLENQSGTHQHGTVYIIGHPKGEIKKIDNCAVLPVPTQDPQVKKGIQEQMKSHLESDCSLEQILTTVYLVSQQILLLNHKQQHLKYDTCLFYGSSGSPVLNTDREVVAMHCAGIGKTQFLFEYGTTILSFRYDLAQKHPAFAEKLFQVQQLKEETKHGLAEQ
ncbi:serine protease FAM111A-like [Heterodontus francisci]|uniref:serine protease FAM111A-like n=1 Tax=Heterodontus francisci TaxID=7792 RepID=UPI00355C4F77